MPIHLTPLKRSQLLDLGGLVEAVLHPVTPTSSITQSCTLPKISCAIASVDSSPPEHPFACGTFSDVFEDPLTRHAWRLYDKMLYLVWWSHRPPCCTECGMQDAWVPSAESEMKCWHCGSGAGSTAMNDIVEDLPLANHEDDDENGGEEGESNADCDFDGGSGGGGPVALYTFFYEWLSRMRLTERGKGIVLPAGESLPAVLRAAYDLAMLLVFPGIPNSGSMILRGGALYLSLVLHRFPAPFPLFRLAGRFDKTSNVPDTVLGTSLAAEEDVGDQGEELQWVDVELLATLIGVSLSDFFESCQVALQYMQNVMTVAVSFGVPSVLWHPKRVEGREEYIMALRRQRRCTTSLNSMGGSGGISPEHTAMIVALELARVMDAQPCSAEVSTRIGQWLDLQGLYPQRSAYRGTVSSTGEGNSGKLPPATDDTTWWTSPLTTDTSPFSGDMQYVLPSPCANALLYVFAAAFSMSALELANMAMNSGLYSGATRFFDTLRHAAQSGNYTLMPLSRRLSPIMSVWASVYFALHSGDRLPLLAALQHIRVATTRDREVPAARVVQRILRKHQATRWYQFNYTIRVSDDSDKQQLRGVYFLTYVSERFAIFTGVRSARKTLAFDNETGKITFCIMGVKEQLLESLDVQFNGPIVAHIETECAKCAIDCVRQTMNAENWQSAVRNLDRCGRMRRRMRVPMLASRLGALASLREATAMASHRTTGASTLLGWGETEVIFTTLPAVHLGVYAFALRRELQRNILHLPRPSLVYGLSENRVIAIYAALVALLERIEQQQGTRRFQLPPSSPSAAAATSSSSTTNTSLSWVDLLLSEEEWECEAPHSQGGARTRGTGCQSSHTGNGNSVDGSPILLPSSTAAMEVEKQQEALQRHAPLHDWDVACIPSFQEVMLGIGGFPGVGGRTNNSRNNRMVSASRSSDIHHRERQQRRGAPQQDQQQQQKSCTSVGNGLGHAGLTAGVNCYSFNLFTAEDCRRRLYRLLQFIKAHLAKRGKHDRSVAVVAATSTAEEVHVPGHAVEGFQALKKSSASPRLTSQQQQSTPPREKTTPKHGALSARNGTTPVLQQQSPPAGLLLVSKLSSFPPSETTRQQQQQQYHHQRHRRVNRSGSALAEGSDNSEHGGGSPDHAFTSSDGWARSGNRSRVRNGGERQGENNNGSCNRDRCNENSETDTSSSRSSSSEGPSFNAEITTNKRRQRRRIA